MDKPDTAVLLLFPCAGATSDGGVARVSSREDYSLLEIRTALRGYHYLGSSLSIILDLKTAYSYLAQEWKTIFDLYANGYPLGELATYWYHLHGKAWTGTYRELQNYGSRLVRRLCHKLKWLMNLRTQVILPNKAIFPFLGQTS